MGTLVWPTPVPMRTKAHMLPQPIESDEDREEILLAHAHSVMLALRNPELAAHLYTLSGAVRPGAHGPDRAFRIAAWVLGGLAAVLLAASTAQDAFSQWALPAAIGAGVLALGGRLARPTEPASDVTRYLTAEAHLAAAAIAQSSSAGPLATSVALFVERVTDLCHAHDALEQRSPGRPVPVEAINTVALLMTCATLAEDRDRGASSS